MKRGKMLLNVILSLFVLVLMTGVGFAQGKAKAPDKAACPMMTLKGTIDYNKLLGGYYMRGIEPGGETFIVNQNAEVLKKLKESGKTVVIEGRVAETGAEYIIIEKIDGKKYTAAGKAKTKPAVK